MHRRVMTAVSAVFILLVAVTPVSAAAPTRTVFPIDGSAVGEEISGWCGFPVTFTAQGTFQRRTWVGEDGITRTVSTVSVRYTMSANGRTLRYVSAGSTTGTQGPGENGVSDRHGNMQLVTVPGSGSVLGETGHNRYVYTEVVDPWDANETTLVLTVPVWVGNKAGSWEMPPYHVLCPYLAG
ncbi:MAG: hypothetical protein M3295_06915 [Chloroflexota bacterium]|nr:hypothetical protein [Chloroflexota bacterium]